MLIDSTLILSEKQAVTASAASSNIADQLAAGGARNRCVAVAKVDETFAGLTGLKVSLQTASDAAFTAPKELAGVSFALADLKAGKTLFQIILPHGADRYIRGYYTVTGTATAGKISLFITDLADM